MSNLLLNILFLSKSYLLGSILPSYFLTMGKDERLTIFNSKFNDFQEEHNQFCSIHKLLANIFDGFKGILALFLAQLMGVNIFFMQLSGIAIIIGHKFPFYNCFKGGKIMPVLKGLVFFYLFNYMLISSEFLIDVLFLCVIIGIPTYLKAFGNMLEAIGTFLGGINIYLHFPLHPYTPIFEIFIGIIFVLNLIHLCSRLSNILEEQDFSEKEKSDENQEEELLIMLSVYPS